VMQYLHAFNNLSHYASDMVNIDAKKIPSFKRGLNPKMMKHVGTNTRTSFNDFVSDCLKQEKNNNVYAASKTHKRPFKSGTSQPKARWPIILRIVYLLLVQGLGHHRGRIRMPSNLRGTRSYSRWWCHRPS
jgi:hypothetical protein